MYFSLTNSFLTANNFFPSNFTCCLVFLPKNCATILFWESQLWRWRTSQTFFDSYRDGNQRSLPPLKRSQIFLFLIINNKREIDSNALIHLLMGFFFNPSMVISQDSHMLFFYNGHIFIQLIIIFLKKKSYLPFTFKVSNWFWENNHNNVMHHKEVSIGEVLVYK
jgi:hypothetical protein